MTSEQLALRFPPPGARFITLTRGMVAIVDEADYERVARFKWRALRGYAQAHSKMVHGEREGIRMHRFLLNAPPGLQVDHINGDTLDNRRANIRVCTNRENARNARRRAHTSSQFKGVHWDRQRNKWRARIRAGDVGRNGRKRELYLGIFDYEINAAKAYDDAARKYFGAFAAVNFPENEGERAA